MSIMWLNQIHHYSFPSNPPHTFLPLFYSKSMCSFFLNLWSLLSVACMCISVGVWIVSQKKIDFLWLWESFSCQYILNMGWSFLTNSPAHAGILVDICMQFVIFKHQYLFEDENEGWLRANTLIFLCHFLYG